MDKKILADYIKKYQIELDEKVIPFWENHCVDKEFGGYFTYLDQEGNYYDTDKYMWMQWRVVYMFATLYYSYKKQESWLKIAKDGFDFLVKYGKHTDGSYYFAINRQGKPIIAPFNIFSEAFVVMGSAALFKCTQEEKYKTEALSAMNHYISRISDPKRQWEKSMPDKPKRLSHGHYMILANLGKVMKDCLGIAEIGRASCRERVSSPV